MRMPQAMTALVDISKNCEESVADSNRPDGVKPISVAHKALPGSASPGRSRKTRQEKADSASRRAGWAFLVPFLGVPVAAFYFYVEEDLLRSVAAGLATLGLAMALSPLMLWWSISGLRRGSRHLLLGVFVGFVGAFLFTAMLSMLVSGGIGWSLITGERIEFLPESFDLTRWIFLSPENPLNPQPLLRTFSELFSGSA